MRLGRDKNFGGRSVHRPHSYIGRPKRVQKDSWDFTKKRSRIGNHKRERNLKNKYGSRSLWCREYYVDTAGKNSKKLQNITGISSSTNPFTGSKRQFPGRCGPQKTPAGAVSNRALQAFSAKPPAMQADIYLLKIKIFRYTELSLLLCAQRPLSDVPAIVRAFKGDFFNRCIGFGERLG